MRLIATTLVLVLGAALNVWAQAAQPEMKRYIVGFKSGFANSAQTDQLKKAGAKTLAVIKTNGTTDKEFEVLVVEAPAGSLKAAPKAKPAARTTFRLDVFGSGASGSAGGGAAAGALDSDDLIVEEDFTVKWIESMPVSFGAVPLPNMKAVMGGLNFQPLVKAVKGEIPWGVKRVKAHVAWDVTEGKGVKVAVIDTGIKATHPDLNGQVAGGFNAITQSEADGAFNDDNGHGTHVSGTIAAKRDGKGVVGVAPGAKLYGVKVLDANGSGSLSDVIRGIIWCANNDMQVVNMSLGSAYGSDLMHRAVMYATARGAVVVAAAGNSGAAVGYPAAYPETIAVAASDWEDKITKFSSRGPEVNFIAPGHFIVSSWLNNNTVSLSGTSMASPHVAGLAALAVAQGARGLGGPDGVLDALKAASKSIGLAATEQGFGMIDASKIVE